MQANNTSHDKILLRETDICFCLADKLNHQMQCFLAAPCQAKMQEMKNLCSPNQAISIAFLCVWYHDKKASDHVSYDIPLIQKIATEPALKLV